MVLNYTPEQKQKYEFREGFAFLKPEFQPPPQPHEAVPITITPIGRGGGQVGPSQTFQPEPRPTKQDVLIITPIAPSPTGVVGGGETQYEKSQFFIGEKEITTKELQQQLKEAPWTVTAEGKSFPPGSEKYATLLAQRIQEQPEVFNIKPEISEAQKLDVRMKEVGFYPMGYTGVVKTPFGELYGKIKSTPEVFTPKTTTYEESIGIQEEKEILGARRISIFEQGRTPNILGLPTKERLERQFQTSFPSEKEAIQYSERRGYDWIGGEWQPGKIGGRLTTTERQAGIFVLSMGLTAGSFAITPILPSVIGEAGTFYLGAVGTASTIGYGFKKASEGFRFSEEEIAGISGMIPGIGLGAALINPRIINYKSKYITGETSDKRKIYLSMEKMTEQHGILWKKSTGMWSILEPSESLKPNTQFIESYTIIKKKPFIGQPEVKMIQGETETIGGIVKGSEGYYVYIPRKNFYTSFTTSKMLTGEGELIELPSSKTFTKYLGNEKIGGITIKKYAHIGVGNLNNFKTNMDLFVGGTKEFEFPSQNIKITPFKSESPSTSLLKDLAESYSKDILPSTMQKKTSVLPGISTPIVSTSKVSKPTSMKEFIPSELSTITIRKTETGFPSMGVAYPHEISISKEWSGMNEALTSGILLGSVSSAKQTSKQLMKGETKYKSLTGQALVSMTKQENILGTVQTQMQISSQVQKQTVTPMTRLTTITPTTTTTTKFKFISPPVIPGLEFHWPPTKAKKIGMAYKTEIFRKGKWLTVSKTPLSRSEAIRLGERIVDIESLSARFRIKPIEGIALEKGMLIQQPSERFRGYKIRKGMRIPLQNEWIEKRSFRLEKKGMGFELPEIMEAKRMVSGIRSGRNNLIRKSYSNSKKSFSFKIPKMRLMI